MVLGFMRNEHYSKNIDDLNSFVHLPCKSNVSQENIIEAIKTFACLGGLCIKSEPVFYAWKCFIVWQWGVKSVFGLGCTIIGVG